MADETRTLTDLADLAELKEAAPAAAPVAVAAVDELPEPKIDAQGRSYATGKRKNAIARVWLKPGKGGVSLNGRDEMT